MALPADVLAAIRQWTGSTPDDAALETVYLATGSTVEGAALSVLRTRRADLLTGALSWAVEGDYREDRTGNLSGIDALIAELEGALGVGAGTMTVSRLVRCDQRR